MSPFAPGSDDLDPVYTAARGENVLVKIVGNSYWPKVVRVAPGTTITWINEDVFDMLAGEETGSHNVATFTGPESFVSPVLGHAQRWSKEFEVAGEYECFCSVHQYMRARIIVDPELA